ncbi:uncharacterized protein LOC132730245 isoform X2 [Ruditapes philippinarum]|uniref:uncharacterized protein LOC132730245 isoform X2 n=1 Tax=Ruditapes philippinarum TaxID=129788 RepID=UPI00295B2C2A|nr:uncharacterized protein LOC132730245 isoform X2 [Ruditapes philippinarum]
MSRAALPGSRGKEKDRSNTRDRSSQREPKVDPVFESIDGPTLQGGEFSADEENTEEELYQMIVRERNIARSSKNNDSQVKGKPGERVRVCERVRRPTEERDENEDRNKPAEKTVFQQPQQQEVFTTAFQLQLGILIVVVVLSILLSILAHYCLFTHLYHIDSKSELSDVDIDKKVKDSLEPEVLKRVAETKSTKVEIEELLQSTHKLDQERKVIYEQLKNYLDRIDNAVKDASNIKTLIPNAEEMNRLQIMHFLYALLFSLSFCIGCIAKLWNCENWSMRSQVNLKRTM